MGIEYELETCDVVYFVVSIVFNLQSTIFMIFENCWCEVQIEAKQTINNHHSLQYYETWSASFGPIIWWIAKNKLSNGTGLNIDGADKYDAMWVGILCLALNFSPFFLFPALDFLDPIFHLHINAIFLHNFHRFPLIRLKNSQFVKIWTFSN